MEVDEEVQIEIENENEKMIKGNKKTKYSLNQTGKQIVSNVFKYFKKTMNTSMAVTETAKATGVSESMIYRVKKASETNTLKPPKKRGRKPKKPIEQMTVCDERTIYGVRKLLNEFSRQNISPSLNVLLAAIKNDDKLQAMSRTSLYRLLKRLGFSYTTVNKKTILTEHDKIIKLRHDYLRQIKKYREDGRPIVYTDETWITIGESLNQSNCIMINTGNYKVMEETTDGKRPSSIKRLKSKALKASTRFILIHAGGDQGLIKEAGHHFLCKKNVVDALYELDDEIYEKWFKEKLLPNAPVGCVIVLDNASHHARIFDNTVAESSSRKDKQKSDIIVNNNDNENFSSMPSRKKKKKTEIDYLDEENNRKCNDEYQIDLLARKSGRTILRLPPYHCELNPMEMVWNRIEQEILNQNFCSITEIYDKITLDDWNNYIIQVKNTEQEIWARERIKDCETDTRDYKSSIFLENYQNDFI